jgi:hydroxyacylglutathione hydrolase
LQFILTVEPENEKTKQKLEWAQKQREANQPTVPSTIGDEFEINTFMRVDLPEIQVCNPHPHELVKYGST